MTDLFDPCDLAGLNLPNRMIMARLSECRLSPTLACRRSDGVGGQHVGIRGPAKRITRRIAVERSEPPPGHLLVCLYVLCAVGNCFPFDDLLGFDQV